MMSEPVVSWEVARMGVYPCPLCDGRDVRNTEHGIQCKDCGIMLRDHDGFEDTRERWNALSSGLAMIDSRHPDCAAVRLETFGARFRELRGDYGMSLRDTAALFGITPTRLGEVERGVARLPLATQPTEPA